MYTSTLWLFIVSLMRSFKWSYLSVLWLIRSHTVSKEPKEPKKTKGYTASAVDIRTEPSQRQLGLSQAASGIGVRRDWKPFRKHAFRIVLCLQAL